MMNMKIKKEKIKKTKKTKKREQKNIKKIKYYFYQVILINWHLYELIKIKLYDKINLNIQSN